MITLTLRFAPLLRFALLAALLLVSSSGRCQSSACDRLLPQQSDSSFDLRYYDIALSADPTTQFLSGSTGVRVSMRERSAGIFLSLSDSLHVRSITSEPIGLVKSFEHANDRLCIGFENEVNAGATIRLEISYDGKAPAPGYTVAEQLPVGSGEPLSYTFSEPFNAPLWFPCKNDPGDKADSAAISITCAFPYVAISNGSLIRTDTGNASRVFHWSERYPIATYLLAFALSDFSVTQDYWQSRSGPNLPIDYFVFKTATSAFDSSRDGVRDMLDYFSSEFGEYPFLNEKYGFAQFLGGGMEHQTISFVESSELYLLAHETAHQWFGDKITCQSWSDIWLNEGFATYLTSLFREHRLGRSVFEQDMAVKEQEILRYPGGSVIVPDTEVQNAQRLFDGRLTYNKGAWVLHMLRDVLGEKAFFTAMKDYAVGPFSYASATTRDFQHSIEASSHTDLGWFFDQWVYGAGYPTISAQMQSVDIGGLTTTIVRLTESTSDPATLFFSAPVELRLRGKSLDTTIRVWFASDAQTYTFDLPGRPDSVTVDPDNHILGGSTTPSSVPTDRKGREEESAAYIYHRGSPLPNWLKEGRLWQITGAEVALVGRAALGLAEGIYFWTSKSPSESTRKLLILP